MEGLALLAGDPSKHASGTFGKSQGQARITLAETCNISSTITLRLCPPHLPIVNVLLAGRGLIQDIAKSGSSEDARAYIRTAEFRLLIS